MLNSLIIDKNRLISLQSTFLRDDQFNYNKFDSNCELSDLDFQDIYLLNKNLLMNLDLFIVTDKDQYVVFKNRVDGNTGTIKQLKTLKSYIAYLESHYDEN